MSEQVTSACKIFNVIEIISGSLVFKAAIKCDVNIEYSQNINLFITDIIYYYEHKKQTFHSIFMLICWFIRIILTLNGNNKLRNNWKDFSTTFLQHIEDTLHSQESVWVLLLSDTLEENWQVMVVVELLDLNLPVYAVLWAVLNSNWQVTSVVESSEFTWWDVSLVEGASLWFLWCGSFLGFVQTHSFTSETFSLLQNCYKIIMLKITHITY